MVPAESRERPEKKPTKARTAACHRADSLLSWLGAADPLCMRQRSLLGSLNGRSEPLASSGPAEQALLSSL